MNQHFENKTLEYDLGRVSVGYLGTRRTQKRISLCDIP